MRLGLPHSPGAAGTFALGLGPRVIYFSAAGVYGALLLAVQMEGRYAGARVQLDARARRKKML